MEGLMFAIISITLHVSYVPIKNFVAQLIFLSLL